MTSNPHSYTTAQVIDLLRTTTPEGCHDDGIPEWCIHTGKCTCHAMNEAAKLLAAPQVNPSIALLTEVSEFLERHQDTSDGEDGPQPDKAMLLRRDVELEIERLKNAAPQVGPSANGIHTRSDVAPAGAAPEPQSHGPGNGQWIALEERKPEPHAEVLVRHILGDRGRCPKAIDIASLDNAGRWYFPWCDRLGKEQAAPVWVTHWMPVPQFDATGNGGK